jgi:hypothetical protein
VAASKVSAKSFGTRTDEVRQVGISAGIPDLLAGREMPSLIGGGANRLQHYREGGRFGVFCARMQTYE